MNQSYLTDHLGREFKFKRGRKIYKLSSIKDGFLVVFHDEAGIEHSVDIGLFPNYFKNRIIFL